MRTSHWLLALPLVVGCRPDPIEAARAFFATRPTYEQPLAEGFEAPAGLELGAAACGTCHAAIYEEWRVSTHAHAWVDRQLQEEMKKSENRWMCQNCHTPLMRQQARWPTGLTDGDVEKPEWVENPRFDAALQAEGITCVSCHLRDGVLVGPTGAATPAHPTKADPTFLSADICLRCHQAVATYPGKTFTCTFRTGEEWAAGPYGKAGQPCQGCHMQAVDRPSAEGAPARAGRRHYWPGGGLPKVAGVYPPADQLPPGLALDAAVHDGALALGLVNAAAGHMLPTGDPERFYRIAVRFLGADGAELGTHAERIGQTWEWWPAPKKLGDNRLAPGERREVAVPLPEGTVQVEIVGTRHRMTEEAFAYHDLAGYPIEAEFDRRTLTVP